MSRLILTMFSLVCLIGTFAEASELVPIKNGFLTGNSYLELSDSGKIGYAMGFLDGVLVSPMFGATKSNLAWIEQCTVGMTNEQMAAIFNKFLRDNPSRWHEPMNLLAWVAIKQGCN